VLADSRERERAVGEDDGGLGALDLAGAIEQGIEELFGTERSGLKGADVQAGGLGMTVADLVCAADGDRPRRGAGGVVKPERLIGPVPGQVGRVQRDELARAGRDYRYEARLCRCWVRSRLCWGTRCCCAWRDGMGLWLHGGGLCEA
jgi:hypothetical protein